MYNLTLDFHDQTMPRVKTFDSMSDLALYLERVPSMLGFEINGSATIHIEVNLSKTSQTPLPFTA